MKKTLKLLTLMLFIALASCSKSAEYGETSAVALEDISTTDAAAETTAEAPQSTDSTQDITVPERMIVKEGNIRFETSNAQETRANIVASSKKLNGYLSQDTSNVYGNRTEHTIVIRVPAKNFETLLEGVTQTATKVDSKNINALDVTEEFIDVEARIKTKKEIEERYKELLKRANTIDDILRIERELGALRADIESFEGRLKYLKSRISLSTLTVTFYEKGESTTGFGYEISSAFGSGWSNLLSFVIGLFYIWPFILISIGLIFIIRRIRKRRKQNKIN
ncbi:DUF4349 domain-containing protein [Myroides odoratimimus]|uniref:DUF4349 domain-containing protein n=1 Tax=Myroides odoratimimus TaxID=76832 RepID=UPI002DB640E9|nr:DUF4349 domain-containing protein [Myroides odoratimimus]MEC4054444.1 DUF4349 domain-containing protein [Myroides odoratimimus]